MTKKFQVFISSTYNDLRDERQAAVQGVLLAKHIPAGMELFSAGDASQLQVIKEWISESDIYLVILGARYGSIEPKSGVGYTEIEYDYAVASGMPYFALVLNEKAAAAKLTAGLVTTEDDNAARKLAARDKVLSKSSKLVEDPRDIQICILQSLHEMEKRSGLKGWVRPDDAQNMAPLIGQLRLLSEENASLKVQLQEAERKKTGPDLSALDTSVTLRLQRQYEGYSVWHNTKTPAQTTWRALFGAIAMKLLAPVNDEYLSRLVACHYGGFGAGDKARVAEEDWETVKAQFLKLDFVNIYYGETIMKTGALFWALTPLGKEVGLLLRAK